MAAVSLELSEAELDQLAEALASRLAARLGGALNGGSPERWLDMRAAADYLGVHRDTLRKLAAEGRIPSEQEGPGCRRFFRVSDLDGWRNGHGRG